MNLVRHSLRLALACVLAFLFTLVPSVDVGGRADSAEAAAGDDGWGLNWLSLAEARAAQEDSRRASKRKAGRKHEKEGRARRDRGKSKRRLKVGLRVKNLSRERDGLNWIRLKAHVPKRKRHQGMQYEYFVEDARTGIHLSSAGGTTESVAYVLLPPGKYVFSVVATRADGKRSTKSLKRRIPGQSADGSDGGLASCGSCWAFGSDWQPGDPYISVSDAGGVLSASSVRSFFADRPSADVLGDSSSSGCGSMMNDAGDGISIATGMLSVIPGAGPLLGPINATSAGLKLVGGRKSSACTQAKFDAINEQLEYQESQIQQIYTIIDRGEDVFFAALTDFNDRLIQGATASYDEYRTDVTDAFNDFMVDGGMWDDAVGIQAIAEAQVQNYADESPGLAQCTKNDTRCCYRPYRDDLFGPNTDVQDYCEETVGDGAGPLGALRAFADGEGLPQETLRDLLGSEYQPDFECTYNCYTRLVAVDPQNSSPTAWGLLLDNYVDELRQQISDCTSVDLEARSQCEAMDNNVVELYENYNAAVVAIYQQSLYSLQQAYSMEWLVNQFNFFSEPGAEEIRRLVRSSTQQVPGTYYRKNAPNPCASATTGAGVGGEEGAYNCAQEQLTLAYAQRVNLLYQNALRYIVTDKPLSMQRWPELGGAITVQTGIGPIALAPSLDYDTVVGGRLAEVGLDPTPKEHVSNVTGEQSASPNLGADGASYTWSDEAVLYQFSVQDVARCFHTLETFQENNAVDVADPSRVAYIEDVFATPEDCSSVFALPDGSPPNQGFFDGRTLQPYDQLYVSPGSPSGEACDAACDSCESGQDPNDADPAPDPPIDWAAGGHGLQVLYDEPAADWASASSGNNGSWAMSCRNGTLSGDASKEEAPPTLCAECLDESDRYAGRNCAVCPSGRWGNADGALFCEGTTELCRGYCSGDNLCGDFRYATGPEGDRDYTDCAKCGAGPVLALSAPLGGNVRFCSQSADAGGESPYQQLLAAGEVLEDSNTNYDMDGNQMTWFEPPASYAGNQAGLQPEIPHLTCGNWVTPPTVDEWLKAKGDGTRPPFTDSLADDTAFAQQNPSGQKAVASVAWDMGAGSICGAGFTKMHGPFCEWDQDYMNQASTSATDVWKTCGKLNWDSNRTSDSSASYAGFTMSFTNPATGLVEGGLPIPLGLVKQCLSGSPTSAPTSVVAPFALYEYDADTDTTTTNPVSDYGYVCTPTYIDNSLIAYNSSDPGQGARIGDIDQTLTCSLLDGSEYRVGIRRVETVSNPSLARNETFVTVKQANGGCPEACYECQSGAGGLTEGGLALVTGTDGVEVCDGYCSGYGYCGGKEYNQPNGDIASVDCTRCGAGDDDGDPQSDKICAGSEGDRCVSAPGTDIYYGKKYVNSLTSSGSQPGSGQVTTLAQMVNDLTATKISGAAGLTQCANGYFPRDPAVGFAKHCITSPSPSGARLCASTEGDYCACDGDVYYGKKFVSSLTSEGGEAPGDGPLTTYSQLVSEPTYRMASDIEGGIDCSYTAMGGDPAYGFYKHCYCVPGS